MKTKICTKCKEEKALEDFGWRNKPKGIRRSDCKSCLNKSAKKRYYRMKEIAESYKEDGCCKCGEIKPYLLDFHHIDPKEKEIKVSTLLTYSNIDKLVNEINKCVVLCFNCHREFHHFERENGALLDEYLNYK